MTAPLMPRATAVWLVENTTLTFRQIAAFCELHELEVQAIADGDVSANIMGLSPIDNGQLELVEIKRCEDDAAADLIGNEMERNVKARNQKAKKVLSPSQRQDKPCAIFWILKNYPELKDSQICKLIGTTKPTVQSLRDGSHREMANIRSKNPVTIGLCNESDIEAAVLAAAKRNQPKPVKEKTAKVKKAKVKKVAKAKKPAKAKAPKKEKAVKVKAPKKEKAVKVKAEKKAKPAKVKAEKKVAAKKPTAKKTAAKKTVAKKPAAKKTAVKKTAAKKAPKAKKAAE